MKTENSRRGAKTRRTVEKEIVDNVNQITGSVINTSLEIQKSLGPGLFESVERLAPVHSKQLLTYLKLLNLEVGLLINFGESTLKEGLYLIVSNFTGPSLSAPPRLRVRSSL